MATTTPLDADEEVLWRALVRVAVTLPRGLDDDLTRAVGISFSEYGVLTILSEAENQAMRLSALAGAVALSLSRVSRLVDGMQAQGLVTKERDTVDTRGSIARLTPAGLDQLRAAYPVHLASVRQRVIDHVAPELVRPAARAQGGGVRPGGQAPLPEPAAGQASETFPLATLMFLTGSGFGAGPWTT